MCLCLACQAHFILINFLLIYQIMCTIIMHGQLIGETSRRFCGNRDRIPVSVNSTGNRISLFATYRGRINGRGFLAYASVKQCMYPYLVFEYSSFLCRSMLSQYSIKQFFFKFEYSVQYHLIPITQGSHQS